MLPATREQYELAISPEYVAFRAYAFEAEKAIEDSVAESVLDDLEIPITHLFDGDIYIREMSVKCGTVLTGAIHKFPHFIIASQGTIALCGPGGAHQVIKAPFTVMSKPGAKRVGVVVEDAKWSTIHRLPREDMRDIEEIEKYLFCNDESEFQQFVRERIS